MIRGPQRGYLLAGALAALVAAGALTAVTVPTPHPGGDNAAYLSLAHSLVDGDGYVEAWDPEVGAHTKYPPGFPLLLGALIVAGASTWIAFKLFTAVLVSLAVLLAFAWTAERRGPLAGLAVALLTLFSAGWLDASRWILSEPAFLVFTFLALWAAERGLGGETRWPEPVSRWVARGRVRRFGWPEPGSRAKATPGGEEARTSAGGPGAVPTWIWLILAGGAAIAAFLARSAGLPLVIALGAALLLARRPRAAVGFGVAVAIPAAWWGLRARLGGEGAYQDEFWMVNPYEPELGTVGWTALPGRAWTNARLYVGEVLPGEWWGGAAPRCSGSSG